MVWTGVCGLLSSQANLKTKIKYHLISFSFYGPTLIIFSLFFIIPAILGFGYSFTSWNGYTKDAQFIGLENFRMMMEDTRFFDSIQNTLLITIIQVFFFNVIALIVAVLIENAKIKKIKNFLRSVYFFPYVISYVIIATIWNYMLNYRDGVVLEIIRWTGLNALDVDYLGTPSLINYTIAGINVWAFIGFYIVIYLASLQTIPESLYESAEIDGAKPYTKFIYITIPLVAPAITINAVISVAWGLQTFEPILILTQGGPGFASETVSYYIYWAGFLGSRQGYGTAISLVLFIAVLIISIIQIKFLRKREIEF
jgi:ABC-type sugar transport system permease subunit